MKNETTSSAVLFDVKLAMREFNKRRVLNQGKKQINNADLPAGAPMHYYCRFCGEPTATLPETHSGRAPTICEPCAVLHAHGVI